MQTMGRLASRTNTDHSTDSHFSCESKIKRSCSKEYRHSLVGGIEVDTQQDVEETFAVGGVLVLGVDQTVVHSGPKVLQLVHQDPQRLVVLLQLCNTRTCKSQSGE